MSFVPTLLQDILWICAALLLYAYLGYPIVIWCLSRLFGKPNHVPAERGGQDLPTVSLLIVAYNEEAVIAERLENALAMDYPPDRLEIVVASDGSTDATPDIVRRFEHRGVQLLDYAQRRGKAAVINSAVAELRGDIILMTDANTSIDAQAPLRIARWFADPAIGVVCGQLTLTGAKTGNNVDNLYWQYENILKQSEGRLNALLGANGAIYAIRRSLFVPVPPDTIVDDFVIPLMAKLRSGCKIVFDPQALAREEIAHDLGAEFRRRARLGAGGYQSVRLLWRLLDPRRGWIAFTYLSHKILRWSGPFLLAAMLIANVALLDRPFYRNVFFVQIAFYVVSILAVLVPMRVRPLRLLLLATMFTGMNAAFLVGFCRWLAGRQGGAWTRTARAAELSGTPR